MNEKKCEFMFNNLGKMIKENDDYQYLKSNENKKDESFDEDNI
jgi:hypothetical protein